MRRRRSFAVAALALSFAAAVVLLVPSPAHSQTGYPPGPCVPTPQFPNLCLGQQQQQQQQQQQVQQQQEQQQPKPATAVRGRLSLTGANVTLWAAGALVLLLAGALLVTATRRRASARS